MYRYPLPLALVLALLCTATATRAAQQAAPSPTTRVWTNADMDRLRAQGLISIVGAEPEEAPATAAVTAPTATPAPVYASRTEDPAWYAEQVADLQAQLSARQAALAQAQDNLAQAKDGRGVTGSFNLAAGDSMGVTPEEVIANLGAQLSETQSRLDELADLARRNDIPLGILRGTPA